MKILSLGWLMFVFLICGQFSAAQTAASYAVWKAKQEQHDQRLKHVIQHKPLQQRVVQVEPIHPITLATTPQILGDRITVNINQANIEELTAKLEGIGRKKAQAIVDYRQQYGSFKRQEDLLTVKGIGEKTLQKNRDRIVLK